MRNWEIYKKQLDIGKRPKDLGLLIVVGGPGGSGASTIARMLARYLGLSYVYAGGMMRAIAEKNGFKSYVKFIESEHFKSNKNKYDKQIDRQIVRMSQRRDVLIDSKTFAALAYIKKLPCTVKIWIEADLEVRVHRALYSRSNIPEGKKVAKKSLMYRRTMLELMKRYSNDKNRYARLYGIDYDRQELYNDIVINSSKIDAGETFTLILKLLKDGKFIKSK